jgi:hypothetical protein
MPSPVLHDGVSPALSPETGGLVLAVGAVVFVVIAYDVYRQWWVGSD